MNPEREPVEFLDDPDDVELAATLKALGNPVRLRLVRYMLAHPGCITGDLVEFADLAQSTVSRHLQVLRNAGIVEGEAEGSAVCYCLNPNCLPSLRRRLRTLDISNQG